MRQVLRINPVLPPSDLLDAYETNALAPLNRRDEVRRLQQGSLGAAVQPGEVAAEDPNAKSAALEIQLVHIHDLKFAARQIDFAISFRLSTLLAQVSASSVITWSPRDKVIREMRTDEAGAARNGPPDIALILKLTVSFMFLAFLVKGLVWNSRR